VPHEAGIHLCDVLLGKWRRATRHTRAGSNVGQRNRALKDFRENRVRILVATDVAARGIDVDHITHVINYDLPQFAEDYVHRIGRTGRAFQQGKAITFVNKAELYHIEKIEKLIREKIQVKPLPAEVEVTPTPFQEKQEIAKAIDDQKRRDDPDFKGAFHEKKGGRKE